MKEALFSQSLANGRVLCNLCPLYCQIGQGRRGACGVRLNIDGTLYTLVYDKVVSRHVDPIEKKPLFHFYPSSRSYSIATVGCSFRCLHCQNYEISQQPKGKQGVFPESGGEHPDVLCLSLREAEARIPGERVTPMDIVRAAENSGCRSIAFTYTEPTIFYELAYDTGRLASAAGLANVFVTNGYITQPAFSAIAPLLGAANIDLKCFDDATHKRMTGAPVQPVLDAIQCYKQSGIWVEVTTSVIPGCNDSDHELRRIARFIQSVGKEIPWHVLQFYPAYRCVEREPTPFATLRRAREIGYESGLQYVYEGNAPGSDGEYTYCHTCGSVVVRRYGHQVLTNRITAGCCPDCGTEIPGVGM
jgi:pyruvate formate lyase activating enzyme